MGISGESNGSCPERFRRQESRSECGDETTAAHNTLSADTTHVRVFYPFHPLYGYRLRVSRIAKRGDCAASVIDPAGKRLKIPVWMLLPQAADLKLHDQAHLSREALLNVSSLVGTPPTTGIHDNLPQTSVDGCKGGPIMQQLPLIILARTEEELLPVDLTVRAELVGLMAHVLVTAFQTEVRRADERTSIQSQDQARTSGS